MNTQKLKLGLLLDSFELPAWLFHSLERIASSDYAEFSVVILKADTGNEQWNQEGSIYKLFNKIDEKLFLKGPNALEMVPLHKMLASIPAITVSPISDADIDVIKPEDVKRISGFHLDILIKVGFQQLGGEIATAAKYGVWFYEHTDNRVKRGGPPGFWEVAERCPDTGATLLMMNSHSQGGQAIYRSRFLTYPFSPARSRNTSLWASSSFLPRQIELLHDLGEARFFQETAKFNSEFDYYDHQRYQTPGVVDSIKVYTRLFFKNLYEGYQRATRLDAWYLMFGFSKNTALAFADLKKIVPPKDRFWADPHIIRKDDKYFIFVEEYPFKTQKGHISVIEMDSEGHCKDPVRVLETNYHLSYPSVFEYENTYYMVPESAHNRTIDLYECVEFPTRWEFKMTLMDNVIAKDTTLFFHAGKWWLFTGLTENVGAVPEVELFLFYSDDLFTREWKSHPLNPIISDVTTARPAGRLFTQGGRIYRPSQDCSKNYGYGFNINEILCLTETDYLEKKVTAVKPNWESHLVATHTYNYTDGFVVIDVLSRRSKFI